MHDVVELAAFSSAAILPFFVVLRWRGGGFVIAVLFGWGIVHVANLTATRIEPVDGVIVGLWAALGWAYMFVWCLFSTMIVVGFRFMRANRRTVP